MVERMIGYDFLWLIVVKSNGIWEMWFNEYCMYDIYIFFVFFFFLKNDVLFVFWGLFNYFLFFKLWIEFVVVVIVFGLNFYVFIFF